MSGPDWSKAPNGATHWGAETKAFYESWYRIDGGQWLVIGIAAGQWVSAYMSEDLESKLTPRPTKPRWRACYGGPAPEHYDAVMLRDGYIIRTYAGIRLRRERHGISSDIIAFQLPDTVT